jgi:hypothetical protein
MAIVSKVEQVARVDFGDPGNFPLDRSIVTLGVCGTPLEALEEGVFLRLPRWSDAMFSAAHRQSVLYCTHASQTGSRIAT